MPRYNDDAKELRRKRAAIMWLFRVNGLTWREIGELLDVTRERARQIVCWYERLLRQRAYAIDEQQPFEKRLKAAGAIPKLPQPFLGDHPMAAYFMDTDLPDE
jgi:hypothetical protein